MTWRSTFFTIAIASLLFMACSDDEATAPPGTGGSGASGGAGGAGADGGGTGDDVCVFDTSYYDDGCVFGP